MKEERIKQLMVGVGYPNSRSIYQLILQVENETQQGWKDLVRSVIDGSLETVDLPDLPINVVMSYLYTKYGIETDTDNLETNGWQWDYWFTIEHKGKEYCLEGNGFYGNQVFGWCN